MNKKPNIENLISLIEKWKINKTMLAEQIGMRKELFQQKISPNVKYYSFTDEELIKILNALNSFTNDVRNTIGNYSRTGNYYFKPEKFQNSLKKSPGVVSGKKKEFAGGTLVATGKNNPDSFQSFKTDHVIIDCDESGNPVDVKKDFTFEDETKPGRWWNGDNTDFRDL